MAYLFAFAITLVAFFVLNYFHTHQENNTFVRYTYNFLFRCFLHIILSITFGFSIGYYLTKDLHIFYCAIVLMVASIPIYIIYMGFHVQLFITQEKFKFYTNLCKSPYSKVISEQDVDLIKTKILPIIIKNNTSLDDNLEFAHGEFIYKIVLNKSFQHYFRQISKFKCPSDDEFIEVKKDFVDSSVWLIKATRITPKQEDYDCFYSDDMKEIMSYFELDNFFDLTNEHIDIYEMATI